MINVGLMKSTLKPAELVKPVKRLDRYAEHEWHKQLNNKATLIAELKTKGHIINILA